MEWPGKPPAYDASKAPESLIVPPVFPLYEKKMKKMKEKDPGRRITL